MSRLKEANRITPTELYRYLTEEKGVPHNHAVGMVANVRGESNFNPSVLGDKGTSGGLFQHHATRFEALKEYSGGNWTDWKKQVDYTLTEKDTQRYLSQDFDNEEDAAYWFTVNWERPANKEQRGQERMKFATMYKTEVSPTPQVDLPSAPPTPLQPQDTTDPLRYITPKQLFEAMDEVATIEKDLEESPELQKVEKKKQLLSQFAPDENIQTYDFQPKTQQPKKDYDKVTYQEFVQSLPQLPQIFKTTLTQFQDGGTFSEDNPRNVAIKARLAYEYSKGNPAVIRMMAGTDKPYQFEDGSVGTHYMASMDNYAVPLIQDKDGNLVLGDYGPESKEAIRFDSPEDAEYFAENYKKFAPALQ